MESTQTEDVREFGAEEEFWIKTK